MRQLKNEWMKRSREEGDKNWTQNPFWALMITIQPWTLVSYGEFGDKYECRNKSPLIT